MNWTEIAVVVAVVFGIIQGARFLVGKIFKFGELSGRLNTVETDVKEIKSDTKDLGKDISNILKMLAEKGLAVSNSPRVLSAEGIKVLKASGIEAIVNDKFDLIVKNVEKLKPENSYQAEQAVLDVVAGFKNDPTLKDAVEEGAFNSGYFVDSVLFAGGLHIRDRVLQELGFNVSEIDKHTPKKQSKKGE